MDENEEENEVVVKENKPQMRKGAYAPLFYKLLFKFYAYNTIRIIYYWLWSDANNNYNSDGDCYGYYKHSEFC